MPYEKNKTAYQNEEWFEREQRNVLHVRNWNRDLMGQTFYQICQDNKKQIQDYSVQVEPFCINRSEKNNALHSMQVLYC